MVLPLQPPLVEPFELLPSGGAPVDRDAQRVILQRLTGRIRRIARLFLRHSADADDAAQVALLKILALANERESADTFEHWAERVAVGVVLQHAKRERRRKHLLLRWLLPGRLPWGQGTQPQPYEELWLEEAMRRLSPAQREAFVLRHMLEYTVAEIAELTQTPAGTIKNRLLAARKALRLEFRRAADESRGENP